MKTLSILMSSLVAGCLLLLFTIPALSRTLDTSGTGTPVSLKIRNINLKFAGGHPQFNFHATGTALIHHHNMPGWPEAVILVTAYGSYNYDTNRTTERVYAAVLQGNESTAVIYETPKVIDAELQCPENPWVHGVQGCSATEVQDTIAKALGTYPSLIDPDYSYPVSSFFMESGLRAALLDAEEKKLAGDPLKDWNPYAGTEGTDQLSIALPAQNAVIDENATVLQLAINNTVNLNTSQTIEMEWERVEDVSGWIGDIKMPDGSKMFQPFAGPVSAQWGSFPLAVSIGSWSSTNEARHFRVRVRAQGVTTWTSWRNFWIGQPIMDFNQAKKLIKTAEDNQQKVYNSAFKKAVKMDELKTKKGPTQKAVPLTPKGSAAPPAAADKIDKTNLKKAKIKVVPPTLSPMSKRSFSPGDTVKLSILHEVGKKPECQFEIFNNKKWQKTGNVREFSMHPAGKRGNREITTGSFKFSVAGKYRYRCMTDSAVWSNFREIVINIPRTKAMAAPKESISPMDGKGLSRDTKVVLIPPVITFPAAGQVFTAPADITFKAGSTGRRAVVFELKRGNEQYVQTEAVRQDLPAGTYKVRARYADNNPGKAVSFTIRIPLRNRTLTPVRQ